MTRGTVLPTKLAGSTSAITPVVITWSTLRWFEQSPPTPAGSIFHCCLNRGDNGSDAYNGQTLHRPPS